MANKNIRGITIEIGGDTTKLGKAIEDSEKKSRSLQTELKEIQKGLKFDPTNVELLAQKQTVLTQNIEETSKKLDTLKEAEKQVIAQFERGEVAEEQVRALKREISTTEGVLGSMKSELTSTNKAIKDLADGTDSAEKHTEEYADALKKAEEDLSSFGDKARETFDTIKTGAGILGAGAIAGAGYAVKLSTEFDKAYNTLQTQTGATTEEMKALDESMSNIYKNKFGESIEDVAQSMATVKTQTNLTGQELEKTTQNAILMRDVFGFEVNESIRGVNSLMDQFGITADEAYTLVAQGAQKGLNQNGDLMDVINEYSVHFQRAGYSAEDMFNMLANGVEAGTWSVDKLGDAVKEFNIRMSDGSAKDAVEALGFSWESVSESWSAGGEEARDVFNMLFNELDGLENTTEGYGIGVGLLGTMYEDLGQEAVLALSKTEGEISKTSDALKTLNEVKYDDLGSALEGLGRTLQTDVVEPLGEELKPVVEDAIEYVKANGPQIKEIISNIVKDIGKFVSYVVDNGPTIISILGGIGAGFVTWKVASLINSVVGAIQAFKLVNEGATVAQWALNVAMNANPIGLIITLIAGLVTAFVLLWNNCDGFREFFVNMWEKIKSAVSTAIDFVVGLFNTVVDFVKNNWQGILLFIVNPFAGAFKLVYDNFEGFRNFVDNFVGKIKDFFVGLFNTVVDFFKNNWQGLLTFLVNPFAGAFKLLYDNFEGFRNFVDNIVGAIKTFFINLGQSIVDFFSPVIEWFKELFSSIADTVSDVIEVIVVLATGCWELIKAVFSVVKEWFSVNVIEPVKTFFTELWTKIKDLASSAWKKITEIWLTVSTWFKDKVITPVKKFFTELWDKIKDLAKTAWTKITDTWKSVSTWFKDKVISPVKNFFTGMWDNLKDGASKAWTGIKNVFSKVTTWFRDKFSEAWSAVKNVFSTGGKIFSGITEGITSAFKKVVNAIIGGLNKVITVPFNGINSALDKIRNVSIAGISPFSKLPSISTPQIPLLYQGGILKRGQVGLLEGNGTEAVVPLEKETGWINRIAQKMNDYQSTNPANVALSAKMDEMIRTMKTIKSTIVLDTGVLVGETVNQFDEALGNAYALKARRA